MLQFVCTSDMDMHVHAWLHHQAERLMGAVPWGLNGYQDRREAVIGALKVLDVADCHKRYIGSCTMAKMGHGGGL